MSADPNSYQDEDTGQYVVNLHDDGVFVNMFDQWVVRGGAAGPCGRPITGMVRRGTDAVWQQMFDGGLLVFYASGESDLVPLDSLERC